MPINDKNTFTFDVNVTGEVTGTLYLGEFKAKLFLSHADDLAKDRIRKDLLGPNPLDSSMQAQSQAEALSELQVRIVAAPSFWKDSKNGLELMDGSIVMHLYETCLKETQKVIEDRKKAAGQASEALKKELPIEHDRQAAK